MLLDKSEGGNVANSDDFKGRLLIKQLFSLKTGPVKLRLTARDKGVKRAFKVVAVSRRQG